MSVIAAFARELIAAGVTGDPLVEAIERFETAAGMHRSAGAIRQARYRERNKASRDVTRDASPSSPAPPPDGSPNTPPITTPTPSPSTTTQRARETRLPPDWQPTDAELKHAIDFGFSRDQVDYEVEKFRDYWHARAGPKALKRDWAATWRNWIRTAKENGSGNKQNQRFAGAGRAAPDPILAGMGNLARKRFG